MKIPLSKGKFALIDNSDADRVGTVKWWVSSSAKNVWYARGYIKGSKPYKTVYLHRFLLNPPDELQVDHINGNTLDCRRRNMRLATNQQNCVNSRKKGGWRFRGVTKRKLKSGTKWIAQIKHNYRVFYLGIFHNQKDAARAYDHAAKKLFGTFGRINGVS